MKNIEFSFLGKVTKNNKISINLLNEEVLEMPVKRLEKYWKIPFGE
jgi:hypothetical protein